MCFFSKKGTKLYLFLPSAPAFFRDVTISFISLFSQLLLALQLTFTSSSLLLRLLHLLLRLSRMAAGIATNGQTISFDLHLFRRPELDSGVNLEDSSLINTNLCVILINPLSFNSISWFVRLVFLNIFCVISL